MLPVFDILAHFKRMEKNFPTYCILMFNTHESGLDKLTFCLRGVWGRHDRDRMVVGFAISAYYH